MKNAFKTTALVIAFGLTASSGFAANTESNGLTRAQVRAEYLQAQKAGTLPAYGDGPMALQSIASSNLSRAEVKAEYLQAQKAGALPAYGDAPMATQGNVSSNLSRADVKAEYLQAKKAGTLPLTGDRS